MTKATSPFLVLLATTFGILCFLDRNFVVFLDRKGFFVSKSKFLYFKVLEETYVPYDYKNYLNVNNEKDYYINTTWKQIYKEKCICPSNYMELAYETKS